MMLVFMLIIFASAAMYFNQLRLRDLDISRQLPSSDLNVVVIVVDTLRADHVPFHGYEKDTAPFLNSLAERGAVFDWAMSSSSTTAPATATLFTSLYPSEHGILVGYVATQRDRRNNPDITLNRISGDITTLGEVFYDAGFRTYAVNDNMNISREMGFDQGFERFETYRYRGAQAVNDKVLEWKDDILSGGRYFMYLHYMDPHMPYNQQAPWYDPEGANTARERTVRAYDSEINYVDQKIKELSDIFGWEENAIILFTSDHGEEFWEHGRTGHGKTLFREVIHIPLFIYHPGMPRQVRIDEFVHLVDVLPTLADLLDLPFQSRWRGDSLMPLVFGRKFEAPRMLYAELLRRDWQEMSQMRSVVMDGWHYIVSFNEDQSEPINTLLFNLKEDFNQQNDLLEQEAPMAEILAAKLAEFEERVSGNVPEEFTVTIDDATFERLRTLGYVE